MRDAARVQADRAREAQFEQVLKDSPTYARAHYGLGVLAAAAANDENFHGEVLVVWAVT